MEKEEKGEIVSRQQQQQERTQQECQDVFETKDQKQQLQNANKNDQVDEYEKDQNKDETKQQDQTHLNQDGLGKKIDEKKQVEHQEQQHRRHDGNETNQNEQAPPPRMSTISKMKLFFKKKERMAKQKAVNKTAASHSDRAVNYSDKCVSSPQNLKNSTSVDEQQRPVVGLHTADKHKAGSSPAGGRKVGVSVENEDRIREQLKDIIRTERINEIQLFF